MAKLIQPPQKFVTPEWIYGCRYLYGNAEAERAAAERLVMESQRTMEDTKKTTERLLFENKKRTEQRLNEVRYRDDELNRSLEANKLETEAVVEMRARVDKMIESLQEILHISQQCLVKRERRIETDLVHDDPEKHLIKEVEVIQGALALLVRTKEQIVEQLRLNRKAKYNLDKDLADKFQALAIDGHVAELHLNSQGNRLVKDAGRMTAKSTSVDEWADFTERNLTSAEKQRRNSVRTRAVADGVLQTTCNDINRQRSSADLALEMRVHELRDAKEKFEEHLKKVKKQITEMEDNILHLGEAIEHRVTALKLVETRLENRTCRPRIELCRDQPQSSLVETDSAIKDIIENLQMRLNQSKDSLKALDRKKLELEHELAIKTLSLFIDETEVMAMRQSMHLSCF